MDSWFKSVVPQPLCFYCNHKSVSENYFLGLGLGMLYIEIAIIALIILVQTFLIIILHKGMITEIQKGLFDLDAKLATAVQNLISGNIDLPDPINPMQQMIMQIIQSKINPNPGNEKIREVNLKALNYIPVFRI